MWNLCDVFHTGASHGKKSPEYFKQKIIPDADMTRLRKIYFNEQR